jgi:hypothetical protein
MSNPYLIPDKPDLTTPFTSYNIEAQGEIAVQIYMGNWPNIILNPIKR